jgi:hypothetical protein
MIFNSYSLHVILKGEKVSIETFRVSLTLLISIHIYLDILLSIVRAFFANTLNSSTLLSWIFTKEAATRIRPCRTLSPVDLQRGSRASWASQYLFS